MAHLSVDALKMASKLTVTVRIKRWREWSVRLAVAGWLMRAAAWLIGCNLIIEDDQESAQKQAETAPNHPDRLHLLAHLLGAAPQELLDNMTSNQWRQWHEFLNTTPTPPTTPGQPPPPDPQG